MFTKTNRSLQLAIHQGRILRGGIKAWRDIASSATFLRQFRYRSLGMASPTVGWALLYYLLIKKMPHRSAGWRQFFSSSQMTRMTCDKWNCDMSWLTLTGQKASIWQQQTCFSCLVKLIRSIRLLIPTHYDALASMNRLLHFLSFVCLLIS